MNTTSSSASLSREDLYPSRTGGDAMLLERRDPVVHGNAGTPGPLSQEQMNLYEEQGFLILNQLFDPQEVAGMCHELERLRRDPIIGTSDETISEPDSGEIRSIFRIHQTNPLFSRLKSDPRLAGAAHQLLDDDVYIHQSRLNYKPGFRGREFYWHSDFETWHVEDGMPRMRALSMSVTLTENFEHNGPLMLIPGSHRQYLSCTGVTPEQHFRASLKKQEYGVPDDESLARMVAEGGIVSATGKPGSVIIFDCNLMHGSNGNITPHPRSNVFFVYNALSNKVVPPFCDQPPRPEYICSRQSIEPIEVLANEATHG